MTAPSPSAPCAPSSRLRVSPTVRLCAAGRRPVDVVVGQAERRITLASESQKPHSLEAIRAHGPDSRRGAKQPVPRTGSGILRQRRSRRVPGRQRTGTREEPGVIPGYSSSGRAFQERCKQRKRKRKRRSSISSSRVAKRERRSAPPHPEKGTAAAVHASPGVRESERV
eukprot:TRINITY_DN17958_c3_g1_i2.p2 TRINITY_DN17958_c3_g1~~TRINITY_DN17958_c3_g1_i2.p2  ORF type:complete len:186 (+),score=5.94 TRINITY_DN17958_c3_g1_i2:52-558(+)